jgi:subtilisin family serine protease
MHAEDMWKTSTGKGVKVALLDSGVNPNTSSLKGQVLADEVPKTVSYGATNDDNGHGTTMAELIAGTGAGGGLKGLAPGAKIVPYHVELSFNTHKKTPQVADAITAAADSDARIINMSFGGEALDPAVEKAIKYAKSKGKLMFAAAGNEAKENNLIDYPAAYPYVVGIAAAGKNGKVADFSEHGDYVDLSAPGLGIPGWCDGTFRSYCDNERGTSQATAIASASAALIWSAHPNWTANQVLRTLIDTAGRDWSRNERSNYLGYGIVRPRKVLENPHINPGPPNSDPLSFENGNGVDTATSSPSSSASSPAQAAKNISGGGTSAAGANANSSNSNTQLWYVLGGVAVAAALGGGAFAVARRKRTA